MRVQSWRLVLAAAALWLAGCATVPRGAGSIEPWPQRLAALQAITQFTLQGRLAVTVSREGSNDGFSAGVRWRQQGDTADVDLSAPLGFGAAHVTERAGALKVTTSHGEVLDDAAAAAELQAQLGFQPPLASLRYWLLGASAPGSASQPTLDAQQRLAALQQDGWQLQYEDYVMQGQRWLPRRLTLSRPGLRLRLIINDWQF